jgi:hypothetical protein
MVAVEQRFSRLCVKSRQSRLRLVLAAAFELKAVFSGTFYTFITGRFPHVESVSMS